MNIEIPENATNGDVFKIMFPELRVVTLKRFVMVAFPIETVAIWDEWWNAQYRGKGEIHCNCSDEEIAKSFISDVKAVRDLLPRTESEG